jgi:hypothetical protein
MDNVIRAASLRDPRLIEILNALTVWADNGDRFVRGDVDGAVLFFGDSHVQQYMPRVEFLSRLPARYGE